MDNTQISELNSLEIENSNLGFENLSKLKQKKLTLLRTKYQLEQKKNISLNYDLSKIKHLIPSPSDDTIELEDSGFDNIVREIYGVQDYYIEADMEFTDNSFADADILSNDKLSDTEINEINQFVKNGYYRFYFQTIIKDLGIRKILPVGEYRVIRY